MLLAALACAGCDAPSSDLALGARYVDDDAFRRERLEASLVDSDNGYSTLRLERYGYVWSLLDAWNPEVRPLTEDDIGAFVSDPTRPSDDPSGFAALDVEGVPWTRPALLELGRRAFERYPVQLADAIGWGTRDRDAVDRYGLSIDDRGQVGGLVRVRLADGTEQFAVTCASCHARPDASGHLVHGASASGFDWGRTAYERALERGASEPDVAYLADWGPGQVDVTPDDQHNAAAMTDLRQTSRNRYLHWAGTIDNELIALAIRLETLLITSTQETVRPPREVSFALAFYVWSMGEGGRPARPADDAAGAELFVVHCAGCHGADGTTPRPRVRIAEVGTDPRVGESSTRGTGFYRTPSLWRVAERDQLLHDGSVSSLEELLDPSRVDRVTGHAYGFELEDTERAALLAYVRAIGAP